jgi:hypothetical protein
MSASEHQQTEGLAPDFWDRLERLERRHWRVQWDHELARRAMKRLPAGEAEQLQHTWRRYCEVIAELDQATAAIASLRTCAS